MKRHLILLLAIITNSVSLHANNKKEIPYPSVIIDTIQLTKDTSTLSFIIYKPKNCNIHFTKSKPDTTNKKILLSVAAAFTGKDFKSIMGNHVVNGKSYWGYKESPTGFAALIGNKVIIKPIEDSMKYYYNKAIRRKGDFFQQMLLVDNKEVVPCPIFKDKATFRRALVYIGKDIAIIESEERLYIEDFSKALIEMGVNTAICLDMGTWSFGWYRSNHSTITHIGKLITSTKYQTNWIIFR